MKPGTIYRLQPKQIASLIIHAGVKDPMGAGAAHFRPKYLSSSRQPARYQTQI